MSLSKKDLKELKENNFIKYKGQKRLSVLRLSIVVIIQIIFIILVVKYLFN